MSKEGMKESCLAKRAEEVEGAKMEHGEGAERGGELAERGEVFKGGREGKRGRADCRKGEWRKWERTGESNRLK